MNFKTKFDSEETRFNTQFSIFGEGGSDGKNGATFIPSVSKEGIISWQNDQGLPNPTPVNIKGEKGADGTPATHRWSGTTLYMTSASGTSSANLKGDKGDDGYTPVKNVDYFDGKDGQNGSDGKDGNGIESAVLNADYTLTLTFDDGTSYTTPNIRGATGNPGVDGNPGADGVGIASVHQTTTSTEDDGNNVFTITLTDGTSATFTVQNGSKGNPGYTPQKGIDYFDGVNGKDGINGIDGKDGYTPVKGVDYYTPADKAEMVQAVLNALPNGDEVNY